MSLTLSGSIRILRAGLCAIAVAFSCGLSVEAAEFKVEIKALPDSSRVLVEGDCAPGQRFSFRDSYGGVLGLGARISDFRLFDSKGAEVQVRRIAPGQYEGASAATRYRYEIKLTPPSLPADAAKVSWLNSERGLLVLGDLLPVQGTESRVTAQAESVEKRKVRFELPPDWSVQSNEKPERAFAYEDVDPENGVFVVGNRLRNSRATVSGMSVGLVIDGDWAFADNEALELIAKVLKSEGAVFGSMPRRQTTVILLPYATLFADRWSAETRGGTVTLLIGKIPSKIGALAQLSTPLTHELFHLWVPNALALSGEYDWFYEGFTVYQAARIAVQLDLLTFSEFLRAIGRAYDAYLGSPDRDRWSLVEFSQRRWTSGQMAVYQKSMLIAFLYDLKLRFASKGKQSLDEVYRSLLKESSPGDSKSAQSGKGNNAVIGNLTRHFQAPDFAVSYIEQPVALDLEKELTPFGFVVERAGLRTRVSVVEKPNKQQRDLLRQLGYNDATRSGRQK